MKHSKLLAFILFLWLNVMAMTACRTEGEIKLANTIYIPLEEIRTIAISYDEENLQFFPSQDDILIIQEYMPLDKRRYHAKVRQRRDRVEISEGSKPLFSQGFQRRVEVYLPAKYQESLAISSTSGRVDLSRVELNLSELRIDNKSGQTHLERATAREMHLSSTSGRIEGEMLRGDVIRLESTSGQIRCDAVDGKVDFVSTSGDLHIGSAQGAGSYRCENTGSLYVYYQQVDGDLFFYNKSGDTNLTLPRDLAFCFSASKKDGVLSTDFQELLRAKGRESFGVVGKNPSLTVEMETRDGSICVNR